MEELVIIKDKGQAFIINEKRLTQQQQSKNESGDYVEDFLSDLNNILNGNSFDESNNALSKQSIAETPASFVDGTSQSIADSLNTSADAANDNSSSEQPATNTSDNIIQPTTFIAQQQPKSKKHFNLIVVIIIVLIILLIIRGLTK